MNKCRLSLCGYEKNVRKGGVLGAVLAMIVVEMLLSVE